MLTCTSYLYSAHGMFCFTGGDGDMVRSAHLRPSERCSFDHAYTDGRSVSQQHDAAQARAGIKAHCTIDAATCLIAVHCVCMCGTAVLPYGCKRQVNVQRRRMRGKTNAVLWCTPTPRMRSLECHTDAVTNYNQQRTTSS